MVHQAMVCSVIRHVAFEDLGSFATPLEEAGFRLAYCDVGRDDLDALDPVSPELMIILGGPIGVYEEARYPFLETEIGIIGRRLESGRPLMGICLGAQLIARAAGGRVYRADRPEVGFSPITLTDAGRISCLAAFENDPVTLHWHGDTFTLPAGATRLALTAACENQAFSLGPRVIGFQFHPEIDASRIEQWLIGHSVELTAAGMDVPQLRAEAARYRSRLRAKARSVIGTWLGEAAIPS